MGRADSGAERGARSLRLAQPRLVAGILASFSQGPPEIGAIGGFSLWSNHSISKWEKWHLSACQFMLTFEKAGVYFRTIKACFALPIEGRQN